MSWRINSKSRKSRRWRILARLPLKKLSRQITSCLSRRSRSHRCDPRNPAPPVTSVRTYPPPPAILLDCAHTRKLATVAGQFCDRKPLLFQDTLAPILPPQREDGFADVPDILLPPRPIKP